MCILRGRLSVKYWRCECFSCKMFMSIAVGSVVKQVPACHEARAKLCLEMEERWGSFFKCFHSIFLLSNCLVLSHETVSLSSGTCLVFHVPVTLGGRGYRLRRSTWRRYRMQIHVGVFIVVQTQMTYMTGLLSSLSEPFQQVPKSR